MARPFKLLDASQGRPRLDRYELVAELAAGGMATVFLARIGGAGGFQRFVAIKRLHPHLAHETEFVEMFLDEARLAASIHHPNVVPILEVGETPAGYYLVMEYIEGDTLWNLRATSDTRPGTRLSPAVALRIVHDALLGLHAAHELRDEEGHPLEVVHRDVSPQNILVGVDGLARITDFGVAKATARLSSTRSGEIKGKMAYMSPEQVAAGDLDRRSDLFAMGIVLWEALAGRSLFLGPNEVVTMHRVLHDTVPSLLDVVPGTVSPGLAAVVARSLERDPARRFASCQEMADAIVAAVGSLVSSRDVAQAVESIVGARIAERKDAIQRWLATSRSVGATGTWNAASPDGLPPTSSGRMAVAPAQHTPSGSFAPASGAWPGGVPTSTPPPRPGPTDTPAARTPGELPPELAANPSLTTGSSLSPLLAAPGSHYPPALDPAVSSGPSRRWLLALPLLALLAPIGWALSGTSAPATPASVAPPVASPTLVTPSVSASAPPPVVSSPAVVDSAPVASASAEPSASSKAAPTVSAMKPRLLTPPGGIEDSPYR